MTEFERRKANLNTLRGLRNKLDKVLTKSPPDDLFTKCPSCKKSTSQKELEQNLFVCPHCGHHYKLGAYKRLRLLLDRGNAVELGSDMEAKNPIGFPGYEEKLEQSKEKTKLKEGVVTGTGSIGNYPVVIGVLDSGFIMGSMSSVVGEKITRAIEYATEHNLPFIMFSASGGARMQEGIFSLVQMAKTSAALAKHNEKGLLYISYLTHPTTGGVSASFAMLGDIILSEPEALIGFAGPRVIQDTIKSKLPEGFQTAEFVRDHGFVDAVVHRKNMRETLIKLLQFHQKEGVSHDR